MEGKGNQLTNIIQDTTTGTMLQTLEQYHKNFKNKNLKASCDKSFFSLDLVKFLGHQIQNKHMHPHVSELMAF